MAEKTVLSNHSVNRQLRNILRLYDDSDFREKLAAVEPELRSSVQAIELFARQLSVRISSSSDQEVSQNGLRQIDANLQNVWNELNAFQSNSNAGHLTNAASNLDGALTVASWAFFSRSTKGSRAYGESVASVQKAAEGSIAKLQSKAGGVGSRFTAFENKLESLEKRAEGSEGRLSALSSEADAQLAEIRSEFASIKTEIEQERQQDRDSRGAELEEFLSVQKSYAEEITKKIGEHEDEARKILQIVGNIGLTGNYLNRASAEKTQADILRLGAIVFFVAGAAILGFSVIGSFQGQITPVELVARAFAALTISAPAFYLAKESARHRTNSDKAKQTELELASLTPFLNSLPEEQKQEVIASLSSSYFGSQVDEHKVEHPAEFSADQLMKILVHLIDGRIKE